MGEISLNKLEPGNKGTILRIDAKGMVRQRIAEMGLSPGAEVTMVRRAPLNDPLELLVRGYHITLRNSEAAMIIVNVAEA
jgi:Fe2+ transport system protein FeoA